MKNLERVTVTQSLLNEVETLAAPRMPAVAHRAGLTALDENGQSGMTLVSYSAEFKEGAGEGETVNVVVEEAELGPADLRSLA